MERTNYRIPLIIGTALAILIFMTISETARPLTPRLAERGMLDLSDWDFASLGRVRLDGEWEFYWNELLSPEDFETGSAPEPTGFIELPGAWNGYPSPEGPLPGDGYATYRLTVKLPRNAGLMAIKIPSPSTAHKVWADDELIAKSGVVGRSREEMTPQYRPLVAHFHPHGDVLHLTIQVSNFHHRKGGLRESLELGLGTQMDQQNERALAVEMLLFGGILVTSVYHLGLYLLYREDRSILYFGLFTLLMALRAFLVGSVPLTKFFPDFDWELETKLEYLTAYVGVPLVGVFFNSLYPREITDRGVGVLTSVGAAFSLLVLLTPARVFSHSLPFYSAVQVLATLYYLCGIVRAALNKRVGATYLLLGAPLIVATTINDALYVNQIVNVGDLTPAGVFVLILIQSFILAQKFRQTHELASTDPLTGVFNRNFLHMELERQLRSAHQNGQPIAIVIIDLDNYKIYNDTHGHLRGDELLSDIAQCLKEGVRKSDIVARFGGDEFIMVLPGVHKEEAEQLMRRLADNLQAQVLRDTRVVGLSWGIATYPNDGNSIDELLNKADKELYRMKKSHHRA